MKWKLLSGEGKRLEKTSTFPFAFTTFWIVMFLSVVFCRMSTDCCERCETFGVGVSTFLYCTWNSEVHVAVIVGVLLAVGVTFIWYVLTEKVYPYLKPRLSWREVKRRCRSASRWTYDRFFGLVLYYFKNVNRKAKSKLAVWFMKCETLEHVDALVKMFKWVVLPATVFYICIELYFFGENVLDSAFLGILTFSYSNFLPDLPSIFRRKIHYDVKDPGDLPWYKKYLLLLFAPLFVVAFLCGARVNWKTTETFHNLKSLLIYCTFLLALSFFVFVEFPLSAGNAVKIFSLPLYGLAGYATHLKTDQIL